MFGDEVNVLKKLPIGIQTFRDIILNDFVYVDKTRQIYNLIRDAKYYFLSRPRRFGKSLLLDTIGEVFGGDRELFNGLWIYNSDYTFIKHPVIKLDMSGMSNESPDALKESIMSYLDIYYEADGLEIKDKNPADALRRLIMTLNRLYGQKVVVLIDEYDKPILDHIEDLPIANGNRQVLRGFYGILKSMDPYLGFVFITGVTKFTKTSIFSGLNNLRDITMSEFYSDICGIPVESLDDVFAEHIANVNTIKKFQQFATINDAILAWYDGYSWDGIKKLLNPFSLLNFFADKKINSYWYATGTPWFLIDMIKKKPESYLLLHKFRITEMMLDTFDIDRIAIEPLLFQTGYLTVREVEDAKIPPAYVLDIPNQEVRDAFNLQVVSAFTESGEIRTGQAKMEINEALESGDLRKMLDILRGLFASIPYELHVEKEAYYHSVFYAIMTLLGFDMEVEVSVSRGRVDAVLELEDKVYVMEFKYEKCPRDANEEMKRKLFNAALNNAMIQINNKRYGDRYIGSGKKLYKAAFAFLGRDDIEMIVVDENQAYQVL